MLVTDSERIAAQARFLSTQAKEPFLHYEHNTYGYNYRMSVVAAIGRGQMEVLPHRIERSAGDLRFTKMPKDVPEIRFMPEIAKSKGNRWLTTFYLDEKLKTIPRDIIKSS